MKTRLLVVVALLFFFYSGCGHFPERQSLDSHLPSINAKDILTRLGNENAKLRSFKGVGSIILRRGGIVQTSARIAWMGSAPIHLYIVVLTSGHPVTKIAVDGKWVYFHSTLDKQHPYRKILSKNPNLKWLIPVSIRASELLALLSGRVPVLHHHSVQWVWDDIKDENILVVKKWWRDIEKIYLDKSTFRPYKIEVFDLSGSLLYGALLENFQQIDEYDLPMTLTIYGDNADSVQLDIDQYWANVSVSPSQFVIPEPE